MFDFGLQKLKKKKEKPKTKFRLNLKGPKIGKN